MGKIKLSLNPIFVLFIFISVYAGWQNEFLIYFIVLLLHEFAHYFVARLYGYKLNKIVFMPYGAGLSGESNIFKPSHEVVIALAGPMLNMILAVLCVASWWLWPTTYGYSYEFFISNIALGAFNLLPIFPLDGGRIIVASLSERFSKIKLYNIMQIIGFIFSSVFAILFFVSVFTKLNLTLAFISFFLLISSIHSVKDVYYERSYIKNFTTKIDTQKPVLVKTMVVSHKVPIIRLLKYVKGNNFTEFVILDDNHRVIKRINESELKDILMNEKQ